jgi:DNA-binding NarL/FixJ family response regulator
MKDSERKELERISRILIVDDHPIVRESLKRLIQTNMDLTVCGEAEDREQALGLVGTTKPHLIIADLSLKHSHGTELIRDLREHHPKVLVLVLSMHDELLYAERAVRSGAHGYITKQESPVKILAAIRKVLGGEIYWSERAAARVASKIAGQTDPTNNFYEEILTRREMQVFELIGIGKSARQIAVSLHVGNSTVETYRARIKEKLNLKSSAELLQHAIRWSNSPKL